MTDSGSCEAWPVTWTCDVMSESPAATGRAVAVATDILWGLSGRQFGECSATFRPCRRECGDVPWGWVEWPGFSGWPRPALIGGLWFNLTCGSCGGGCTCSSVSEVLLPAPASTITQVKIDGIIVSGSGYRLDDERYLVRLGGGEWPTCNDLNKDDTEPGTWSVTATFGRSVPEVGKLAAGELACEVLKAMNGEDCRLPANVQQLVRQGVTITMPDPATISRDGLLGLYWSDIFIRTVNPSRLASASAVYRVDDVLGRRMRMAGT